MATECTHRFPLAGNFIRSPLTQVAFTFGSKVHSPTADKLSGHFARLENDAGVFGSWVWLSRILACSLRLTFLSLQTSSSPGYKPSVRLVVQLFCIHPWNPALLLPHAQHNGSWLFTNKCLLPPTPNKQTKYRCREHKLTLLSRGSQPSLHIGVTWGDYKNMVHADSGQLNQNPWVWPLGTRWLLLSLLLFQLHRELQCAANWETRLGRWYYLFVWKVSTFLIHLKKPNWLPLF